MVSFALAILFFSPHIEAEETENRDPQAAERHFKAGVDLLKIDDIVGAVREFERAVDNNPTVAALFNLANCYKALNRHMDSMRTFQRLRKEFGEELKPALEDAIERHMEEIREVAAQVRLEVEQEGAAIYVDDLQVGEGPFFETLCLSPGTRVIKVEAAEHETFTHTLTAFSGQKEVLRVNLKSLLGTITISANVADARVRVDGEDAGVTPLESSMSLIAGEHVIEVSKEGYRTVEEQVQIRPRESVSIDLSLTFIPQVMNPGLTEVDGGKAKGRISALSWVGVGLTGATCIASAVLYVIANSHHQDFMDDRAQVIKFNESWDTEETLDMTLEEGVNRSAELARQQDESEDKTQLFSNLGLGVGIAAGALAVTTAVLIAVDLRKEKAGEKRTSVRFGTTPTSAWIRF